MKQIAKEQLDQYRARTFRSANGLRVKSMDEAVAFVEERGFIFFWPIKDLVMPSLWVAAAGDRPVADEHDDPGHVTWGWKDSLLGKQRWYYGRGLRRRNMMVSLDVLPYFYALSPNYGDPREDYLIDYEAGRLPMAAKLIYETLLDQGPQDTIALRKNAGLTSRSADTEFNRALDELQTTFRVMPVGVSQSGAWHYSFIYDIVARHLPEIVERSHPISEHEACQKLLGLYLDSVGAVPFNEIKRIFGNSPTKWETARIERDLTRMEERGEIRHGLEVEGIQHACVGSKHLTGD
jgi:hypothetical protein